MNPESNTPQNRFDRTYITSSEICNELAVTRPAVHYRRTGGKLPGAIQVYGQQLLIWEREGIRPHLNAWKAELESKRSLTT